MTPVRLRSSLMLAVSWDHRTALSASVPCSCCAAPSMRSMQHRATQACYDFSLQKHPCLLLWLPFTYQPCCWPWSTTICRHGQRSRSCCEVAGAASAQAFSYQLRFSPGSSTTPCGVRLVSLPGPLASGNCIRVCASQGLASSRTLRVWYSRKIPTVFIASCRRFRRSCSMQAMMARAAGGKLEPPGGPKPARALARIVPRAAAQRAEDGLAQQVADTRVSLANQFTLCTTAGVAG
jgi:hypothetical protein